MTLLTIRNSDLAKCHDFLYNLPMSPRTAIHKKILLDMIEAKVDAFNIHSQGLSKEYAILDEGNVHRPVEGRPGWFEIDPDLREQHDFDFKYWLHQDVIIDYTEHVLGMEQVFEVLGSYDELIHGDTANAYAILYTEFIKQYDSEEKTNDDN